MSEQGPGFVVVGVGGETNLARTALRFAANEANRRMTGVRLIHACKPNWNMGTLEPVLPLQHREQHGLLILRAATKQLLPLLDSGRRVEYRIYPDTAVNGLLEQSQTASLIVVQRRKISSLDHLRTGSTTSTVAAKAQCPVAVVRQDHNTGEPRSGVVVGIDDAGHAGRALRVGFEEAALRKATLTAVHVCSTQDDALASYGWEPLIPEKIEASRERARVVLAEAVAGCTRDFPDVVVRQRVIEGPIVAGLLYASQDSELLVLGRHGKSRIGSFALGGVARCCLTAASCPVLITPTSRQQWHSVVTTSIPPGRPAVR